MGQHVKPAIVDFADSTAEVETSKPSADRLLSGSPVQTIRNFYADASSQFFAGIWESSPGRWRVSYTEHEFCHLTRGRIRIEDEDGRSWTFGAGSSFVIPAGFSGIWEVLEAAQKLYVVFQPADS